MTGWARFACVRWIAVLAVLVTFASLSLVGTAAETILFFDDFESYAIGPIPISPVHPWTFIDLWGSSGYWPAVEYDGASSSNVLHILSPGSSQRRNIGTVVELPALDATETLELSWDFRLNAPSKAFFLEIVDRWFAPSGGFGEVTQDPKAPVWSLAGTSYRSGLAGDPLYPYTGLSLGLMSDADPTNPNGPRDAVLTDVQLQPGVWHNLTMAYQGYDLKLLLDGVVIGEITSAVFDLSEAYDWMINLGDGDSHSYSPCDVSIDNLILRIVSEALLIDVSQPKPLLCVTNVDRVGDAMEIEVTNFGAADCAGQGRLDVGLSYDMTWIPEWETQFHAVDLGYVSLAAGDSMIFTIDVPEVPGWAVEELAERLTTWWTGYTDRDPDQDYMGFIVTVDTDVACGFSPL